MNEFEWLKQTRALAHPTEPRHDLWPDIAQRIQTTTPVATHRNHALPWAMVATIAAITVLAGWFALRQQVVPTPRIASTHVPATRTAPWKPRDPRLVGAAIELNIARQQLGVAIRRSPNDIYLQHMLNHTNQQITRLQRLEHRAG